MITVEDIAWIRVSAPDLDLMQEFLGDFGLHRTERSAGALYMRGCGTDSVVHITQMGPARSVGFALKARSRDDLVTLAQRLKASVVARDEPGGGYVVTLTDPDGNQVEVVHGCNTRAATHSRPPVLFNPAKGRRARFNTTIRMSTQPSQVLRCGHIALRTGRFAMMRDFYQAVLGMRISDSYHLGTPDNVIVSFLHCGLGEQFVDHHTVALIGDGRTGFEHVAFEVLDFDDLMMGNLYLSSRKRWTHSWGVGRHVQGSQIFDYWRDPFGNKVEHWTDGDLVNDQYCGGSVAFDPATCLSQWGPPVTPEFMD